MQTKHLLLTALVALLGYNTNAQTAQADCRVDSIYSYKFITGTSVKEKTDRTINSYDANNNQTQKLYQTWDGGTNTWKNSDLYNYTYDVSKNKTQQLRKTWDDGTNSWKNFSKRD